MNSSRRNNIRQIIKRLNEIGLEIESVKDEEQDYLDNIPENLQMSQKYYISEEAIYSLEEAKDSIEEAIESLEEAKK